jgi:uncharacterized protein YjbI with pentapeptide repeats
MVNARLTDANLRGASLDGTDLSGVDLDGVALDGVDLSKSKLDTQNFVIELDNLPLHLRRVFLDHETWLKTNGKEGERGVLVGEALNALNLSGRNLSGMVLKNARLKRANLSRCVLAMTDMSGADLTGANLERAFILGTLLRKANLANANLAGVVLKSVEIVDGGGDKATGKFQKPDLDEASLLGAQVAGLDWSGCSTRNTRFT